MIKAEIKILYRDKYFKKSKKLSADYLKRLIRIIKKNPQPNLTQPKGREDAHKIKVEKEAITTESKRL